MICLETAKPGDVLTYHGDKCEVQKVLLERDKEGNDSVSNIIAKMLEGEEKCDTINVFPAGFERFEYLKKPRLNTRVMFTGTGFNFKKGKIYEVVDGKITDDSGYTVPYYTRFDSMHDVDVFCRATNGVCRIFGSSEPVNLSFVEVHE